MAKATTTPAPSKTEQNVQPAQSNEAQNVQPNEAQTAQPEQQKESEKVLELRAAKSAKLQEQKLAFIADDFENGQKLGLEVFAIQKQIDQQIALELQEKRNLELQEKRNKKIGLIFARDEARDAYNEFCKTYKFGEATEEEKAKYQELERAKNNAHEILVNAVLGGVMVAKEPKTTGEQSAPRTGTLSQQIEEALTKELASGISLTLAKKNVTALGFSEKTVGTIATAMVKDGKATK